MKKFIAAVMVAAMSLSVSVTGFASSFADINEVPWQGAQTYIDNAHNIGIMMGDTNSKGQRVFRAKDGVTYCESTQIIYSLMKTMGISDSTSYIVKWSSVMNQYHIPQWAQQSVSYCLEKGFVSTAEVSMFMTGSKSNNASREKVAAFLGRAVNSSGKLGGVSSTSLNFSDTASVSAADVPFIRLLVDNSIISGDGTGKFNPSKSINRAEMATIISKTHDAMKSGVITNVTERDSIVSGEITDISSSQVAIHPKQGAEKKYNLADKDNLVCRYDGKTTTLSTITSYFDKGEYLWCDATLNKNGEVVIIQASEDSASKVLKGDIFSISSHEITIVKNNKKYSYDLGDQDDIYVRIDGTSKTVSSLKNYVKKEDVYVELSLDSDDYVKRIIATTGRSESEDTEKGTIVRLNEDKISLRNNNRSKDYKFEDIDDTDIKVDGSRSDYKHLERLFDNEDSVYATLTLNRSNRIVKVVAYSDYNDISETVNGTVSDVSTTKIWVDTAKSTVRYAFSDDVELNIDGRTDASIKDLKEMFEEGYDIDVTLKLVDEEVVKINASTSDPEKPEEDVEIEYEGIIIDATHSTISVQSRTSKHTFSYMSSSIIKVDNNNVSASELASVVKDGYDITAEVIVNGDNQVLTIAATSSGSGSESNGIVEGMVEHITSSAVTMRVGGESYKYRYADNCEIYFGDDEVTIDDMIVFNKNAGVYAEVTLNRNAVATKVVFSEEL